MKVAELDKFFAAIHKHGGSDLQFAYRYSAGHAPAWRMTQLKVSPFPPEQIQAMIVEIISERVRSQFANTGNV